MSSHLESIVLKKNGQIEGKYWEYKRGQGKYVNRVIHAINPQHIHDKNCTLEDGITLRDIFKFLDKNLDYWDLLIGNWCKEIVTEGLLPAPTKSTTEEDEFETTHLEVYRTAQIEVMKGEHSLDLPNDRAEFHGQGRYTKDSSDGFWKKGDTVGVAIEFTPANELADYEVKLAPTFELWYWNYDDKAKKYKGRWKNPRKFYKAPLHVSYTLFDILYGIIWELSFCGPPVKRNKQFKGLTNTVKKLKAGKLKTVPASKVFGKKKGKKVK